MTVKAHSTVHTSNNHNKFDKIFYYVFLKKNLLEICDVVNISIQFGTVYE